MNIVQKTICAALSATFLCGHALASNAEAKISNIQWTVIDLQPNDGVVPTFDLNGIVGRSRVEFTTYGPYGNSNASELEFFSPLTVLGNQVGNSLGSAIVGPTEVKAEASNTQGGAGASADAWTLTYPQGSEPGTLTVAPYSALHLTATGSLNLTRTEQDPWVYTSFEVRYSSDRGEGVIRQSLQTPTDDWLYDRPDMQMSQLNPIDFLITNNSARALPISFDFRTSSSVLTAVPEPGTIGLLLAGLAVVTVPRLRQVRTKRA